MEVAKEARGKRVGLGDFRDSCKAVEWLCAFPPSQLHFEANLGGKNYQTHLKNFPSGCGICLCVGGHMRIFDIV